MTRRLVLLMAILWIAGFGHAKDLHWKDLPRYLNNKRVTIQDGKGMNYSGRLVSTSADAIVIDGGRRVDIPRESIGSITRLASQVSYADTFSANISTAPFSYVVLLAGLPVCFLLAAEQF
jgi:hypothetical protein